MGIEGAIVSISPFPWKNKKNSLVIPVTPHLSPASFRPALCKKQNHLLMLTDNRRARFIIHPRSLTATEDISLCSALYDGFSVNSKNTAPANDSGSGGVFQSKTNIRYVFRPITEHLESRKPHSSKAVDISGQHQLIIHFIRPGSLAEQVQQPLYG